MIVVVCEWVGAILAEEEGSLDVEAKVARRIQWEVRADAFIAKTQHMDRCRSGVRRCRVVMAEGAARVNWCWIWEG